MAEYVAFNAQHAIDYIKNLVTKDGYDLFDPDQTLSAYEFGDGNLNLVFRISDEQSNSVILKQALPYARCVGESWPLTLDRARIEAEVLLNHGALSPDYTAKVLHHNPEQALTIFEEARSVLKTHSLSELRGAPLIHTEGLSTVPGA